MKILNVGCGNETYGTHFIDKNPQKKEVKYCDLDMKAIPFHDRYFDEVYARAFLEHVKNPNFVLKEMYRVLKKGGKLVIIADNPFALECVCGKTHLGAYEEHHSNFEDRHYQIFTNHHMRNHFKSLGLKNITISDYSAKNNDLSIRILYGFLKLIRLKKYAYASYKIEGIK